MVNGYRDESLTECYPQEAPPSSLHSAQLQEHTRSLSGCHTSTQAEHHYTLVDDATTFTTCLSRGFCLDGDRLKIKTTTFVMVSTSLLSGGYERTSSCFYQQKVITSTCLLLIKVVILQWFNPRPVILSVKTKP